MNQTLAILLDAYRELNAKKLFWITLVLSGVAIGAFGALGVGPNGLSLLSMKLSGPGDMASYWYRDIFSDLVGFWAAWGSILLALISTAGIFPDLMTSGSIDLYFSKPIGRARLFLTKYLSGLLFTLCQISVFAIGGFLIFGIRGHQWRAVLFLIVPLVVCLYSYLIAVCVLLGVLTRSTITAVLLTVVFWLLFFGANWAEGKLFEAKVSEGYISRVFEDRAAKDREQILNLRAHSAPTTTSVSPLEVQATRLEQDQIEAEANARDAGELSAKLGGWHQVSHLIVSLIPKTGETIDLLDRKLFTESDIEGRSEFDKRLKERQFGAMMGGSGDQDFLSQMATAQDAKLAAEKAARGRSVPWIIGTSLAFELVVVAVAAWLFCRRDY
jgi:hypothetical protein